MFNPASFVLGLDEMILGSRIVPYLETQAVEPIMKGRTVAGVIVQDKARRRALRGKVVVDASGDAVTAAASGAPVRTAKNYLAIWCLYTDNNTIKPLIIGADPSRPGRDDKRSWDGTDPDASTAFNLKSRTRLRAEIVRRQKAGGGRNLLYPVTLPTVPQFRTTRCLVGEYVLSSADNKRFFPDAIGLTGDWRKTDRCYAIPYRTLVPQKIDGLLAAGRIISTTTDAWEVTRVIPPCAVTGQAAGAAAALSALANKKPRDLPVAKLQEHLRAAGVRLPGRHFPK